MNTIYIIAKINSKNIIRDYRGKLSDIVRLYNIKLFIPL